MKITSRRDELLSTLVVDSRLHPVADDLAGLERLVPVAPSEAESLAVFRNQLPGLLEIRGRGRAHAEQVHRLIDLFAREPEQVETWIDVANAMAVLTNASHLALLLLPVRSEDDAWAHEQFGRHLLHHARQNGDGEEIALARRAVGALPRRPAHLILPSGADDISVMIETMARRVGALQPKPTVVEPGAPSSYVLEQAESLKAFFAAAPDLTALLDGARHLLALVDGLRSNTVPDGMTGAAIEGGLVLSYARLLRVALWPARSAADVAAKVTARDLVRARDADPDCLGALWEIAFGQGETVAGQSSRFLNIEELG
jgi:hypothetical protein